MTQTFIRKLIVALSCALLVAIFSPATLLAQLDTGGITGTVTDPTGAVVPNAKITLTNDATNVATSTVSTTTGAYSLTAVRPGTYSLKAEAPGFQTFVEDGLPVHVQQTLTVDVPFATGNVAQRVTVTAATPLLQAQNAAVGQTIDTRTINDMPLQTRNWASLSQLSAGVTTAPVGQPTPDSGTTSSAYFSVNGGNIWQNDFRLNGINDNIEVYGGNYTGTNAAITPPPDAIEEFKLQSGDFNAEFGHSTAGVVNAVIKSGTNHFHGDLWEYWRNDVLNANLFFNNLNHQAKPEYRQNIFGGTIGGPIFKNKTFFFFDYQGGRYITPVSATSTVPTAGMISSGFTDLRDLIADNSGTATDALGRKFSHGTVFDPATTREVPAHSVDTISGFTNNSANAVYVRDPFYTGGSIAGIQDFTGLTANLNQIPQNRIDPNAIKLLGVYPAPNGSGLTNNFYNAVKQPKNTNTYDIRIDENLSPHDILFGVYDRSLYTVIVPSNLPGLAVGETGGRNDSLPAYAFAVGYTHIFTPTLTNEMHVGMVHSDKFQKSFYGNTFGIPAQYGIGGVPQVANNGGIPPISINGLTHIGVGNYTPTIQTVWSVEGSDNVTKIFRNHTFKAGIQVDDLEGDISQPPQGRGDFNFNGQYSDIPNKNSSLTGIADLLLTPTASTVGGVPNVGGMSSFSGSNIATTNDHRWYTGAFFQDDWKVTPELTLNLGLRWDYFTPYAETGGRQANFIPVGGNGNTGTYYIPKKGCQVARSTTFDALLASSNINLDCASGLNLGNAQKTKLAPRLGFAYRIKPTVVVRGGYGPAYGALGNLGYGGTLGTNYPFVYVVTYPSPDSNHPLLLPDGVTTATMENAFTQVVLADPTIVPGNGLNLYGRQYNYQTPYIQTENLTVQDQFTSHDSIQVGYVGTQGRHLDNLGYNNSPTQILPPGVNPQPYVPFPAFAKNSTYETTNATSSYNSMQLTYEHQMSVGLYLLGNYTWSKCLTNQHTQAEQNQQYRAEWLPGFGIAKDYGLCDTDATNLVHVAGSYALPFGRGRAWLSNSNRVVDAVLGGWIVNFIYSFQSGQPFTVNCPVSTSEFGCFANMVKGQDPYAGPHNYTQWLNPAAFAQPPVATAIGQTDYSPLGGSPQQVRGPGYKNLDASLLKNFTFTDSFRLQFRAEAFDVTNTPQFTQPGQLNFTNAKFSNITGQRNNQGRVMQLALKLFY